MKIIPWDKLSRMSREEIRGMQNKRLEYIVRHQLPYSKFYSELFKKNNLSFDDIKTTDDLQKLPFTNKTDIAPTKEDPGKPRNFILTPDEDLIKKYAEKTDLAKILLKKVFNKEKLKDDLKFEYSPVHFHFTTGRTALPTMFVYSRYDVKRLIESGRRNFSNLGISKDDIAVNIFPYAPHLAFWQVYMAANDLGIMALHSGGGKILGTKKIILSLESMKATLALVMPGYCYHLVREAVKEGRDLSHLKRIIFGGEKVSKGLIKKLKDLLAQVGAEDVKILGTYAMTEGRVAWPQCCEGSDYHLFPDMEFIEVVDKDGNRVGEGEKGEIVYTALDWRGTVVMRYRTGDLCDGVYYEPCPHCGRTVPRLSYNVYRKSDIKEFNFSKVKGELVNLSLLSELLNNEERVKEWQIEIRKKNNDPFELDELIVHIAPTEKNDKSSLIDKIVSEAKHDLGITPIVTISTLEDLNDRLKIDSELKEKRIIDNRPKT